MPAALIVWPNKTFKFLSMPIKGHYPAGFLMLNHLLEIDSPLLDLMRFWSLPYLPKNINCLSLLICTRCHAQDNPGEMYAELNVNMRETHFVEKIHGLDIN